MKQIIQYLLDHDVKIQAVTATGLIIVREEYINTDRNLDYQLVTLNANFQAVREFLGY